MPRTTIRSEDVTAGQVKAVDLESTLDLSSKTVTLPSAAVTSHVTAFDDNQLKEDIALLAFKQATSDSVVKYDLVDQTVDVFSDDSGISAGDSTNEIRDSSGKYFSGASYGSWTYAAFGSDSQGSGSPETATWTCPTNVTSAEVLIVAGGGGGGGYYYAGGGGAGGVVHDEDYTTVPAVVYDIAIGRGGDEGSYNGSDKGDNGEDSVWNVNAEGSGITMTAIGGGGGGSYGASPLNNGATGGSGGGACAYDNGDGGASTQTSPTGAVGYGNAGTSDDNGTDAGEGGGGAGGTASASVNRYTASDGGVGKLFSNFTAYGTTSANAASSGSDGGWFAGGGGGGAYSGETGGTGGVGGGATGARGNPSVNGGDGIGGTGGGGGGASHYNGGGRGAGTGGQGKVLLRYRTTTFNDLTLVSTATTAEAAPTKADLVMTYTNGAGTATINTDIKGWISRDDGTTYTQATLASQGSTGAHTILTAHDLDISGQPSGTAMRYKITTHNQSVTKETRVHAVSLGWS